METILEVLKLIIPSFTVFIAIYFILNSFQKSQIQSKSIELSAQNQKLLEGKILPIKLAAYERLTLMLDRMSIPNMLRRLPQTEQSAKALKLGLLLTVQQEFDHNVTQRIYVSENLWLILEVTKTNTQVFINNVFDQMPKEATAGEFAYFLLKQIDQNPELNSTTQALLAIQKETGAILRV